MRWRRSEEVGEGEGVGKGGREMRGEGEWMQGEGLGSAALEYCIRFLAKQKLKFYYCNLTELKF